MSFKISPHKEHFPSELIGMPFEEEKNIEVTIDDKEHYTLIDERDHFIQCVWPQVVDHYQFEDTTGFLSYLEKLFKSDKNNPEELIHKFLTENHVNLPYCVDELKTKQIAIDFIASLQNKRENFSRIFIETADRLLSEYENFSTIKDVIEFINRVYMDKPISRPWFQFYDKL